MLAHTPLKCARRLLGMMSTVIFGVTQYLELHYDVRNGYQVHRPLPLTGLTNINSNYSFGESSVHHKNLLHDAAKNNILHHITTLGALVSLREGGVLLVRVGFIESKDLIVVAFSVEHVFHILGRQDHLKRASTVVGGPDR